MNSPVNAQKINRIYDYLTSTNGRSSVPVRAEGVFAFGRADKRVAVLAAELYKDALVKWILFTGGVGKDSGFLSHLGIAESSYLGLFAYQAGVPLDKLLLETKAANGGENCRFGLDLLQQRSYPIDLIVVAHATSAKRLEATLLCEMEKRGLALTVSRVGTDYPFDSFRSADQREAVGELLRLADYPGKGWCKTQSDLPQDLVAVAREYDALWKTA